MKIQIGNEEVDLDSDNLKFNEANINEYLQKEASLYNYFYECYNKAMFYYTSTEDAYEALYSKKFAELKLSNSDKLTEALVKSDEEVIGMLKKVRIAKKVRDSLHTYLRSFDKCHDNALNFCYNLRKEMDKIFPGIKASNDFVDVTNQVDELFKRK